MGKTKLEDVFTIQNIAMLVVLVGQALAKYGTDAFSWNAFVATMVLTVLGWFGLNLQSGYVTGRLAQEERRLQLDAEMFDQDTKMMNDITNEAEEGAGEKVRRF